MRRPKSNSKTCSNCEPGHPQALKGLGLIRVRQGAMLDACRMLAAAKQKLPKDDEVGVKPGAGHV